MEPKCRRRRSPYPLRLHRQEHLPELLHRARNSVVPLVRLLPLLFAPRALTGASHRRRIALPRAQSPPACIGGRGPLHRVRDVEPHPPMSSLRPSRRAPPLGALLRRTRPARRSPGHPIRSERLRSTGQPSQRPRQQLTWRHVIATWAATWSIGQHRGQHLQFCGKAPEFFRK
jgi:hypothetical protein